MDQFYTKKNTAEKCYKILSEKIDLGQFDILLEPSAGTGSFFKLLPTETRLGLDIDPKCNGIIKKDYLEFEPDPDKSYIVMGNPPFGKNSSMAVKFFVHSKFAEVIAFILPRTFKRISIQNKLPKKFHMIFNEDLPLDPCCFTPKMSAKCSFQIWIKSKINRNIVKMDKVHHDFTFLKLGKKDENHQPTPPDNADFALKAYGSNCGEIIDDAEKMTNLRPKSWHWIKSNINVHKLKKNMKKIDYGVSKDTVRQDSIGQQELIYLYKNLFT